MNGIGGRFMSKYIEEYLVALGFDLNSEQGKEYLSMCNELEKKQKELEKAGKSASDQAKKQSDAQKGRIADTKEEIDLKEKMRAANEKARQSVKTEAVVKEVPRQKERPSAAPEQPSGRTRRRPSQAPPPTSPKGRPAPAEQGNPAPPSGKTASKGKAPVTSRQDVSAFDSLKESVGDLAKAWENFKRGNIFAAFSQGASGARQFGNYVDTLGGSFGKTSKQAGALKKNLVDMFGSKEAKASAAGIGEAAEGAGEAATGAGISAAGAAAGIAAGITLTTKAIWGMSNGLTDANTNIETMARKLWISDSAAWQLNSTLSAMGKTTADLNDIAINPTLNKQFKTLQQQAGQYDYSGIGKASEKWAEVQSQWQQVNLNAEIAKNGLTAKVEDFFAPLFDNVLKGWNAIEGKMADTLGGRKDSSVYAPQNASYSSNYAEGAKVTVAPTINVDANSDDAQDIADKTSEAVGQSLNDSALIRNVRGLGR